jgi:2-dehydro-3-deoxyphosphogluconate aldolase / (4S)-4-hydroxy-2-oxoglutarate aldolase
MAEGVGFHPGTLADMATTDAARETLLGSSAVPIIGILRKCPPGYTTRIVAAVAEAGIDHIEVTLDSAEPFEQISALAATEGLVVGVGSVTQADQVDRAVGAGAQFVISPVVASEVIAACTRLGVPCVPGAATPTEILTALTLGATAVKVFPIAQLGGPAYLRAIASPLGGPPLVPTGGVSPDNAGAYLAAGAVALGVGGSLFSAAALADGDTEVVRQAAQTWVEVVR